MTALSDFKIGAKLKRPANTIGVYDEYYFGTLDGVEVGTPCDSESESRQDVIDVLHRELPFKIEDLLQDHVDWLKARIAENKRPDALVAWDSELKSKESLLTKVRNYKAS